MVTNSAPALEGLTEPTSPQIVVFNRREIYRASPAVRARPDLAGVYMLALPCSAASVVVAATPSEDPAHLWSQLERAVAAYTLA